MNIKKKVAALAFLAVAGTASIASASSNKITICHATGADTNPFVMIEVSASALNGLDHSGYFIPAAGATNCAQTPPPPGEF